jgi:hypothetical protein
MLCCRCRSRAAEHREAGVPSQRAHTPITYCPRQLWQLQPPDHHAPQDVRPGSSCTSRGKDSSPVARRREGGRGGSLHECITAYDTTPRHSLQNTLPCCTVIFGFRRESLHVLGHQDTLQCQHTTPPPPPTEATRPSSQWQSLPTA